jgi:hypothetical protein
VSSCLHGHAAIGVVPGIASGDTVVRSVSGSVDENSRRAQDMRARSTNVSAPSALPGTAAVGVVRGTASGTTAVRAAPGSVDENSRRARDMVVEIIGA